MTAEILVMNKSGLALAADSAVTISKGDNDNKIYNSANKLFALSKYAPVGIMVYSSAQFMNIPWETIIKMYRSYLGKKKFSTLSEYKDDFLKFTACKFNYKEEERRLIFFNTYMVLKSLEEEINNTIEDYFDQGNEELDSRSIKAIQKKCIESKFEGEGITEARKEKQFREIKTSQKDFILELIEKQTRFTQRGLTIPIKDKLTDLIIHNAHQRSFSHTGIVIAGFGEEEHFPAYNQLDVFKYLSGKLYSKLKNQGQPGNAYITPFAQSMEVGNFMNGIGQFYTEYLERDLNKAFEKDFPVKLSDKIISDLNIDDEKAEIIKNRVINSCLGFQNGMIAKIKEIRNEKYVKPVINMVEHLSLPDLANMAETFVNLESFRKKVTMDSETVGGPIDVAVISKGDGFVWIKRKHYFEKDLNHNFFENYYREP